MEFFLAYLAYWSVLVMAVGFITFMGGIVMLLIPVFKAINEFLKVRTGEKLVNRP
jgi:hypothetical protein